MYIFYTFMQWVESSLRISLCFSCILTCKIILNTNMHRRYLYIYTNCTFVNIYIFPETFVWVVVVVPIATDVVSLNSIQAKCTRYNAMWLSLSVTWSRSVGFFRVLSFPPPAWNRANVTMWRSMSTSGMFVSVS